MYYPSKERPLPALVYFQGGGWTLFDLDTHDRIMRDFAASTRWEVVGIDYPLCRDTISRRSVGSVETIEAFELVAIDWGLLARPLALSGDSSGANLALAAAIELRDRGVDRLDALILSYGVYDRDLTRPSYTEGAAPLVLYYCPDPAQRLNPLASTLLADLHGLPPIHLITAGHNVLRDENVALANCLIEAENLSRSTTTQRRRMAFSKPRRSA
jgi:acetyl esterase